MTDDQAGDSSASGKPAKLGGFNGTYWMCNAIEMWERLAYYVLRPVAPIYIAQATEPGGLHLTQAHKGWIYMWWAIFQSFLPMITGGYADRYGYKKTLFFSVTMNIIGYLLMAFLHNYYGFFAGIIILAIGTAFFKPSLQATIAHNLTKATSSLGWGVFYWIVNVGSLIGHYISPLLLGQPHSADGWQVLFLACAGFTAMNYLMLLTFKDVPSGASKSESPLHVFGRTIANIFEARLVTWLLIMSCFWLMMYQLWDLQPNFIEDWVDSSMVARHMPFDGWREMGDRGLERVPQQVLISLNALLIVLFMVPVSWAVRKLRTLSAMFFGMLVATVGVLVAGLTGNGWILLAGIFFFSLGEMLTGPKKNEYLALIAPTGKKGLYLGYVNIPIGVGVGLGSWLAGQVYGNFGEKASLALDQLAGNTQLVARAAKAADWSDSLERIPPLLDIERENAFDAACTEAGMDGASMADMLRRSFSHDQGQIVNLGLQYLALDPKYQDRISDNLSPAARFVDRLPEVLGRKRVTVFAIVRDRMNAERSLGEELSDSEIVEALWAQFGRDPENLNNLALEYLAQATDGIRDAVVKMSFESAPDDIKGRKREIEERLGIGRTKSFAALSAAMGADDAATDTALSQFHVPGDNPDDQVYAYLISQPHHRFIAVARKDWTKDVGLLREIIESDPAVMQVVLVGIDEQPWYSRLSAWASGLFRDAQTEEKTLAERCADKQDLIQKALAEADWSKLPDTAARLLGLNPFEARALVAGEVNKSPINATRLLWETYHPQYKVWIPFAAIGVIAAIALAIFGQLAKRWADMNA